MSVKCPKCQHENPEDTLFCGKCGTQFSSPEKIEFTETIESPKEELTRGTTFADRYEIIEELGKGGMGRVYRVEDTKLKQEVALKLIKPEIASDKKTIERFHNELKTARMIAHKNVCRMFDLGDADGAHFITMEYIRGEDLKSLVRKMGQLSAGQALSIAKQVCDGLIEAHHLGVVHRDLKPQNIMIDTMGNARIMDFGIARSIEGKSITGAGVMIGTPDYMSPEQVDGKETDRRSDIYSLGVILYEMVTGRAPFEGDTALSIAVKHKTEFPDDPRKYNEQISEELSHIILRCLEKDKEKRFQDAVELQKALSDIKQGVATTERIIPDKKPLTSREITVQFSLKKLLIPALAGIAVIIAAIAIWQLFLQKKAVPVEYDKPFVAVMYFDNNTGDENLDQYRIAISDLLITDLMQSQLINVVREDKLFNILKKLNLEEARTYSSDDLKNVAAEGRATHILQGNYTKAGENLRFNYTLIDVNTDEVIGSDRVSGVGIDSILAMADELTIKIKANFKLSQQQIASDIDKNIGMILTNSPEALKYYSEGRKLHDEGDYRGSINLMEKAIALDPEFAMAYRSLAVSYSNIGIFSEGRRYREKALSLGDRLSERERHLIEGGIPALIKLLELYPEDTIGNGNLGLQYYQREEWDKAIERYEVCRKNKSEFVPSYTQLANSYAAKGSLDKAKEVLEDYIAQISDHAEIRKSLAVNYILRGKLDLASAEMDRALFLDPTFWQNYLVKGDLYMFDEDFVRAEEEYSKALMTGEPMAMFFGMGRLIDLCLLQGRYEKSLIITEQAFNRAKSLGEQEIILVLQTLLARAHLVAGNPGAALKVCEEAQKLEAKDEAVVKSKYRILEFKGHAFLEKGLMNEAQKTAEELKESIEKGTFKKLIRLYYRLMGKIEQKKGNFPQAIEYFEQAMSLNLFQWGGILAHSNQAGFINSLASAYYESGDMERAEQEYQKILSLTAGRMNEGHIFAKAFYNLGKIYEEQRDASKAIEHYEKFLDLWKDADPGLPEVDDARTRLTKLKSQ
jgi:serine/threonine protein kinase/Tfp pilus assembly protein PilF